METQIADQSATFIQDSFKYAGGVCFSPIDEAPAPIEFALDTRGVYFSHTERKILEFFLSNPDQHYSAVDVFEALWTGDKRSSPKTVKVHIRAIRAKLAGIGAEDLISTVRGAGYILRVNSAGWRKNQSFRVSLRHSDPMMATITL